MTSFVENESELLDEAAEACGHDDFGGDEFREGLGILLKSLDENVLLNPLGRVVIRHMILRDLRARLTAEHGFAMRSETAGNPIDKPLVIVGLPRTGTTALQELLALDPQLQGLELWLTRAPKPRPKRDAWAEDPDYRACAQETESLREFQPDLYAIHKMDAGKVDECWYLMSQSFAHSSWLAQTQLPAYNEWFEQVDMVPVYQRHRRNLQLIGSNDPETRWMLKDSTHLFALDAFMQVYPDARVIQTHRDPVESIPSVCGLCWTARRTLNDAESPKKFGVLTRDLWQRGVEQTMALRDRHGPEQFFDVSFPRFRAGPMPIIEEIYAHFDLELSEQTRAAMESFRAENPPDKHPPHRYAPEDWELDVDEIRERFAPYRERYGFE